MSDPQYRFAGWFTLDVRLLVALVVFAAALAVLVLAIKFHRRRWDEWIVGFLALFAVAFLVGLIATNTIATHPALKVETLFAVP
ncbi:MAG: hypothetical protein FJ100_19195 [Deltaproteobacteria bacterium]|nr:hypothetical protein [Deltaproteobacteria bacterium]